METKTKNTNELFNYYLDEISQKYSQVQTSEYGYRTQFENLLKELFQEIKVSQIDHDAKAVGGNKPDFVLSKSGVPILFIEVKDIGGSLEKIEKSEQLARYYGYDNLVLTDYLEFRFFRNGLKYVEPITIATYDKKERILTPKPENFELLKKTLLDFPQSHKEAIKSGSHLAKIMGGKAYRIRENAKEMLSGADKETRSIYKVYETMKKQLIHDMTPESFADMYAQTLVYGLFVARFHDGTPDNFNRSEARELVPASNPLLRHFFDHIAGADFDRRLDHIVDELCEVFSHSDIQKLINNFYGTEKDSKDPVIHFYEDFLQEYDSKKRKEFGAYYTPLPVVRFIVNAVDHILEKDFNLFGGLANSSKNEKGHIVQVLDPATGTGTFLTEVIKLVHDKKKNQSGIWGKYVLDDVLPRLFGFEIMIAPYTIAHLKMSMILKETGFKYFNNRRLGIYLTNSLEEGDIVEEMFGSFGLAESISEESKEANKIKKDKPIMVVIGNPPYSASSQNKGEWIMNLIKSYKVGVNEQNVNSLSDDYVKFIRFAEYLVEKNKNGVVAMITNNSFLDGITHRQMRKHILETFDDIYILNLHGDIKKKEVNPISGIDENVFDIQQGVSINIFIKRDTGKHSLGNVQYLDVFGKRENKFSTLNSAGIKNVKWQSVDYSSPYFFFIPKNFENVEEYNLGFKLDDSFIKYSAGTKFRKDGLLVKNHFSSESVLEMLDDIQTLPRSSLTDKYGFNETSDWKVKDKSSLFLPNDKNNVRKVLYRPLDYRWTYYPTDKINQIIPRGDSRLNLMKEFILHSNIGLITNRQIVNNEWSHATVTESISSHGTFYLGNKGQDYIFPLYIYSDDGTKTINIKAEILNELEQKIGKTNPENVFAYIYAILHSETYREKYKEFLKIDFPRIPYPKGRKTFDKLANLGNELIQYHLLKHQNIGINEISYIGEGENIVETPIFESGKVYINKTQYFGNVSEVAWEFYIGGYQPAQKWLKDRKGRELTNDDIEHYSKIIVVLNETDRLMKEIGKISFE